MQGSTVGAGGGSSSHPRFMEALLASAGVAKVNAETRNIEADTRLKLEGQLPELIQRVLTGQASAGEMEARKNVLEQEFRKAEIELRYLDLQQQFRTEHMSYDVMERLRKFRLIIRRYSVRLLRRSCWV